MEEVVHVWGQGVMWEICLPPHFAVNVKLKNSLLKYMYIYVYIYTHIKLTDLGIHHLKFNDFI